jgi:hypothetical protein
MTPDHSRHLAAVLDALAEYLRGYVSMSAAQVDAVALWIAHTHVVAAFETTPFLNVASPEKRCGKTRLLDVLELVVARPWRAITPTEAVLFRKIEAETPTILLDETDAIFERSNGSTEPLRALLNAGNRRGTTVPRCVGPMHDLVDFAVFCAKALAGIGELPDTVADRSIIIRLQRRRRDDPVMRFRRREAMEIAEPIAQDLASWAQDAVSDLVAARPEIPDALDDRAEEAWEPLLSVAGLAGDDWPERACRAALELSGNREAEDEALGPWLLRDIYDIFLAKEVDRLTSVDLAAILSGIETSPWGDIRGKPLDARALAIRLKPFRIRPRTIRLDEHTTASGYRRDAFEDAWSRYLGASIGHTVTSSSSKRFPENRERTRRNDGESCEPPSGNACDRVCDENAARVGQTRPAVVECVACDETYTPGEKGSGPVTCPACVAKREAITASGNE